MKRSDIRQLKRDARNRHDADAMTTLLAHSIRFGHKRLALIRCLQAEQMGIRIDVATLSYCQKIADRMQPETLDSLLRQVGPRTADTVQFALD